MFRRYLYGKELHDYTFEYGKSFLKTYKNQKKFLFLEFNDMHESSGEVIKYLDDSLRNFLDHVRNST